MAEIPQKEITRVDEATSANAAALIYIDNNGAFRRINFDEFFKITSTYALLQGPGIPHNNIYRGKDLTNVYTWDEIYTKVHSGNFDDLYLGDYRTTSITTDIYTEFSGETFETGVTYYEQGGTINARTYEATSDTEPQSGKVYCTKLTKTENVQLMIAGFDYYLNRGDTALTAHHIILIPRTAFATTAKMNNTNITTGSYYNSMMHRTTLPCYAASLKTALNNHLLTHRTILPNATSNAASMAGAGFTGASSGWAWVDTELQLMNEVQVYGTMVWSSSAYDVGCDCQQLPVFKFINHVQFGRSTFWLRSVVSSAYFAGANVNGVALSNGASNAYAVRPLIVFG